MSGPDSFGGIHPALVQQWQDAEIVTPDSPPEFLTIEQLQLVWKLSTRSAQRRLTELQNIGRIEVGCRNKRDATGRHITVRAYKLLPKAAT